MRSLLPILAFLLYLVVPCLAQQETVGLKEITQTLERPFRSESPSNERIRDFRGDFSQLSWLASLDREQRGQGRVAVRFGQALGEKGPLTQFRWEYAQPNNQEIISDGHTLWVYLPENNQVIQSEIEPHGDARTDDPLAFLTGLGNLSRDFQISLDSPSHDSAGNYVLLLQPRRPSAMIRQMRIVVDRAAITDYIRNHKTGQIFLLVLTKVTDPNDNTTLIEFTNVRVNQQLSADSFNFILPAGVELVRPGGQPMGG
jgi:outer membrane lipoprotein carrier protein